MKISGDIVLDHLGNAADPGRDDRHFTGHGFANSVNTRPLTVGLAIFGAPESGVDWAVISAGTLMAVAPLLVAFLLFQRQFMQSFMQAGIK